MKSKAFSKKGISKMNSKGSFIVNGKNMTPSSGIDPIQQLHLLYSKKVEQGEISPRTDHQNHWIFLEFMTKNSGQLAINQEKYLMTLLKGNSSKWFVPRVLNVTKFFSFELLVKLLDAAILVKSLKDKKLFLTPAIRVFDLRVELELQNKFRSGCNEIKLEILKTLVCLEIEKRLKIDNSGERYGLRYSWDGLRFSLDKKMNPEDLLEYDQSVRFIRNRRLKILSQEYRGTEQHQLKKALYHHLLKGR